MHAMPAHFSLVDAVAAADLQTFLKRAARLDDAGAARVIAGGGVLAVYVATQHPRGLFDPTATVLGLRTFETDAAIALDAVVPLRALLDRLARALEAGIGTGVGILLPAEVATAAWAGVAPPRGGWEREDDRDAIELAEAAANRSDAAAMALVDLGFLGLEPVALYRSGAWLRLTTARGHVLAKP